MLGGETSTTCPYAVGHSNMLKSNIEKVLRLRVIVRSLATIRRIEFVRFFDRTHSIRTTSFCRSTLPVDRNVMSIRNIKVAPRDLSSSASYDLETLILGPFAFQQQLFTLRQRSDSPPRDHELADVAFDVKSSSCRADFDFQYDQHG